MFKMPEVTTLKDEAKYWEKHFDNVDVKVYVPKSHPIMEIVNFAFRAPYLIVFEEKKQSAEEACSFAVKSGLSKIAASFGSSVVFIYPSCEGGWEKAPNNIFESVIEESRIGQYYKDGVTIYRDRFTGNWGDCSIRGTVARTCLYGFGKSADYIAKNYLRMVEGAGLFGKGDITPVVCTLERLSIVPNSERRDIPVVSVNNSKEINEKLKNSLDHTLIKETSEYEKDYMDFVGRFRRMVGYLQNEDVLDEMGMTAVAESAEIKVSPDNCGDDKDKESHQIGYVAYYNKKIMEEKKKVPMLFCFHGGGDSSMYMASCSGWYRVAADNNFLLICVENHMNSTATEMMELLGILKEKYPIDSERIYASGFSMGGCKSWDMFQEYPDVFAGVAPMDATFDVGLNVYGKKSPALNKETVLPVFYVGGEITPLPELPFQELKCFNRMKYILEVNKAAASYDITYDNQEVWENKIWGINGACSFQIADPDRKPSVLTLQLYPSTNGNCYYICGSVSGQGHEVRYHSCKNAWKFLSQFRRLNNGQIDGGNMETICNLYN